MPRSSASALAPVRRWRYIEPVAEASEEYRVVTTAADLAGLAALDLVLIPNSACPIPAFLAERLLPAAPVPSPVPSPAPRRR
jgi:hypothetical protein